MKNTCNTCRTYYAFYPVSQVFDVGKIYRCCTLENLCSRTWDNLIGTFMTKLFRFLFTKITSILYNITIQRMISYFLHFYNLSCSCKCRCWVYFQVLSKMGWHENDRFMYFTSYQLFLTINNTQLNGKKQCYSMSKMALVKDHVYLQLSPDNDSGKFKHYTSQQTDIQPQKDACNACKHPN